MKPDVTIASVYGRGNWLSMCLSKQGLKVQLIDMTKHMGRLAPEDWEGPFGYFKPQWMNEMQEERLNSCEKVRSIERGFIVWLRDQIIELRGPLLQFYRDKNIFSQMVEDYLKLPLTKDRHSQYKKSFRDLNFENYWLVHLAHALAANIFYENITDFQNDPLPLFSPYFTRYPTRRGFQNELEVCQKYGVDVKEAKIIDVSLHSSKLEGLEVQQEGQRSGFLPTSNLVWMLSSEESLSCSDMLHRKLFPLGHIESMWLWIRYRFHISNDECTKVLPSKFLLLPDIHLPWAGSNLVIFQDAEREGLYDAWVRIPTHQRFQTNYLSQISKEILLELGNKFHRSKIECVEKPQSFTYDYKDLMAPVFPVYDQKKLNQLKRATAKNIFWDGPEKWLRLDWTGQMQAQINLADQLFSWHQEQLVRAKDVLK